MSTKSKGNNIKGKKNGIDYVYKNNRVIEQITMLDSDSDEDSVKLASSKANGRNKNNNHQPFVPSSPTKKSVNNQSYDENSPIKQQPPSPKKQHSIRGNISAFKPPPLVKNAAATTTTTTRGVPFNGARNKRLEKSLLAAERRKSSSSNSIEGVVPHMHQSKSRGNNRSKSNSGGGFDWNNKSNSRNDRVDWNSISNAARSVGLGLDTQKAAPTLTSNNVSDMSSYVTDSMGSSRSIGGQHSFGGFGTSFGGAARSMSNTSSRVEYGSDAYKEYNKETLDLSTQLFPILSSNEQSVKNVKLPQINPDDCFIDPNELYTRRCYISVSIGDDGRELIRTELEGDTLNEIIGMKLCNTYILQKIESSIKHGPLKLTKVNKSVSKNGLGFVSNQARAAFLSSGVSWTDFIFASMGLGSGYRLASNKHDWMENHPLAKALLAGIKSAGANIGDENVILAAIESAATGLVLEKTLQIQTDQKMSSSSAGWNKIIADATGIGALVYHASNESVSSLAVLKEVQVTTQILKAALPDKDTAFYTNQVVNLLSMSTFLPGVTKCIVGGCTNTVIDNRNNNDKCQHHRKCSKSGCEKKVMYSNDLCNIHQAAKKKADAQRTDIPGQCAEKGCGNKTFGGRDTPFCRKHYDAQKKKKTTTKNKKKRAAPKKEESESSSEDEPVPRKKKAKKAPQKKKAKKAKRSYDSDEDYEFNG